MATSRVSKINLYPHIQELLDSGKSMIGNDIMLPFEYDAIAKPEEALAAAHNKPPTNITLRVWIVWDNDMDDFPLEDVLARMRETGAAMVVKSEVVHR